MDAPQERNVTPLQKLSTYPTKIECPYCKQVARTHIKETPSKMTHGLAVGLFFLTLVGGLLPYIAGIGKHMDHICSNCKNKVARKPRGSESEPTIVFLPEDQEKKPAKA